MTFSPNKKRLAHEKNMVEKSRGCKITSKDLGTQNLNLHICTSAISGETSLGHYSGELMTTWGIKKEFAHPIVACIQLGRYVYICILHMYMYIDICVFVFFAGSPTDYQHT